MPVIRYKRSWTMAIRRLGKSPGESLEILLEE
jgi:hypothetical protein